VEGNPYKIWDANDMQAIGADSNYWDAHFVLCADINLSAYTGTSFNIIGNEPYEGGTSFAGVFDGNGRTISNFTYEANSVDNVGLFGYLDANSQICNLSVEDVNIAGTFAVGGLVGSAYGGKIYGCSVSGIVTGQGFVGGLIGEGWNCEVIRCSSDFIVTSDEYGAGGMIGAFGGILRECYSLSEVNSPDYAGGLVGFAASSEISSCYAEGIVRGAGWGTGGLIGACMEAGPVIMNNCYSSVQVTGHPDDAGGLIGIIGFSIPTYINACFWDVNLSGQTQSAGGIGKSTEQMKSIETYNGWGCGVWTIEDGVDYPRLAWQGLGGESPPEETYGGGSGEPNNPYLIYTAEQLNVIGKTYCHLERSFRLMADIDMNELGENEFVPIGQNVGFTGIFDGDGHTIQNLSYQATGFSDFKGLFAQVGNYYEQIPSLNGGEVKNLQLSSPNIVVPEGYGIGSLCGRLVGGTIENCSVTDCNVTGGDCTGGVVGYVINSVLNRIQCGGRVTGVDYVGGLAGYSNYDNSVPNGRPSYVDSSFEGNVSGSQKVGGLIGYSEGSKLSGSFSSGDVNGTYYLGYAGGLVGHNKGGVLNGCYSSSNVGGTQYTGGLLGWNSGTISDCYSTGAVNGSGDLGGLVGYNTNCNIYSCYATGKVNGSGFQVGGLVGRNSSSSVRECYATGDVQGSKSTGGLIGLYLGSSRLERCFATGSVRGGRYVGGLVGRGDSGDFRLCYATGNVFGTIHNIGGLVGRSHYGAFNMCYATGNVGGPSYVAGLVGLNYSGAFVGCFWDVEKSGTIDGVAGFDPDPNGAIPKTTVEMQMESTFTDAGWDFVGEVINGANDIWEICEGRNYPKFVWQIPVGDLVCPDGVNFEDYAYFAQRWYETDYGDVNGVELTGDGKVNWEDFGLFAGWWMAIGCGGCGGADFTGEGDVDYLDLDALAGYWLESEYGDCGGAELTGDGAVGVDDLGKFTENWLEGI
jgi:hypothetical protein